MSLLYFLIPACVLSTIVLYFAPKRSITQPVSFNIGNEKSIISSLVTAPEIFPGLTLIEKKNFASNTAGEIWEVASELAKKYHWENIADSIVEVTDEIKRELESIYDKTSSVTPEAKNKIIEKYNDRLKKKSAYYLGCMLSATEDGILFQWDGSKKLLLRIVSEVQKVEYEFTNWLNSVKSFSEDLNFAIEKSEKFKDYVSAALEYSRASEFISTSQLTIPKAVKTGINTGKSFGNKYDTMVINEVIGSSFTSKQEFKDTYRELYIKYSQKDPSKNNPMHSLSDSLVTYYEELIIAGSEIINDYMDRTLFNGNSKIVKSQNETLPLKRVYTPYKTSKKLFVYGLTVVSSWANYGLINSLEMSSIVKILLGAALVLLTAFSILWALVDIDTMYLDMPSFYIGIIVTWILVIMGGVVSADIKYFLPGITMTVLMVFIFELINLLYKKVRGSDGMGMGDTMIILGTIGVPTAISGSWQMGYRITMLSFVLGIIGWFYNKVKNNAKKEEPFAFGPYLALGWMLAVVTWQLTSGVLPAGF